MGGHWRLSGKLRCGMATRDEGLLGAGSGTFTKGAVTGRSQRMRKGYFGDYRTGHSNPSRSDHLFDSAEGALRDDVEEVPHEAKLLRETHVKALNRTTRTSLSPV